MPFYSPEFVISAILVTQKDGMSIPTDIESQVLAKVCEQCGSIVIVEDVHDRWHYNIALNISDDTKEDDDSDEDLPERQAPSKLQQPTKSLVRRKR